MHIYCVHTERHGCDVTEYVRGCYALGRWGESFCICINKWELVKGKVGGMIRWFWFWGREETKRGSSAV